MAKLTVNPQQDKDFTSHKWQEWFKEVYALLAPIEHTGGHWLVTDVDTHALTTCSGVQITNKVASNTVTPTLLYSYQFVANELHTDEKITFLCTGWLNSASGSETVTIAFKVAGTTIASLIVTPKNATNVGWKAEYEGTIRSIGTTGTYIDFARFSTDTSSVSHGSNVVLTINTTIPNLFEVYATWGAAKAGNEIGCSQGSLRFEH